MCVWRVPAGLAHNWNQKSPPAPLHLFVVTQDPGCGDLVSYSLVYDPCSCTVLGSLQSTKCTAGPLGAQNKYLLIKGKQVTFNILSPIAGPGTGAAAHHLPQQPASSCQTRASGATASPCSGWEAGGNQKMTTKERHCSGL